MCISRRSFADARARAGTLTTMPAVRFAPLVPADVRCCLGPSPAAAPRYYDAAYRAQFRPQGDAVEVELNLSGERLPSRIVLHVDPRRHKKFTSTDPLQIEPSHVTWQPRGQAVAPALPVRRQSRALAEALRLADDRALGHVPRRQDGAAREREGDEESALARHAGVRAAAGLDRRDAVRISRRSSLPDRRSDAPIRSARGLDARGQDRQPQRKDRQRARRRRGAGGRQRTAPGHAVVPELEPAASAGSVPAVAAAPADRVGRRPDVARRPVGTVLVVPAFAIGR